MTLADCVYCGAQPQQVKFGHRLSNGGYTYNGVDRRDSASGYELGNVVTACGVCNRAKNSMDHIEFRRWVDAVAGRSW